MYCVRKMTEDLYWVGASERRLNLFENAYPLANGVSYNSYLLLDEKTVLIDTVDKSVSGLFFENVDHVLGGRKLDYLIVQHMEPDHAATIGELVLRHPEVTIVCNAKTRTMMQNFFTFDLDSRVQLVKEMDTLTTGRHTFAFVMAPMVHWPEVMVTYEKTEKILFSADGFGKFGALDADESWEDEARRYFINIVGKYGVQVQNLLKKAATLDIQMICPLHGPILKENLGYYIGKYLTWSSYEPEEKGVVIACASIHGNTMIAAKKLAEILKAKGEKNVVLYDLARDDMPSAIADAYRYDRLVVAAASYDGGIFPCMETFLRKLKAKNFQKRTVGYIQNGTWAPCTAKQMQAIMGELKNITNAEPVVTIKSAMKEADITQLEALADALMA